MRVNYTRVYCVAIQRILKKNINSKKLHRCISRIFSSKLGKNHRLSFASFCRMMSSMHFINAAFPYRKQLRKTRLLVDLFYTHSNDNISTWGRLWTNNIDKLLIKSIWIVFDFEPQNYLWRHHGICLKCRKCGWFFFFFL